MGICTLSSSGDREAASAVTTLARILLGDSTRYNSGQSVLSRRRPLAGASKHSLPMPSCLTCWILLVWWKTGRVPVWVSKLLDNAQQQSTDDHLRLNEELCTEQNESESD